MKKKNHINVAVVGLGFMGVTHLRAWQKVRNARIVAVCDAIRQPENGVLRGVSGNIKRSDDINLGAKVRSFREFDALLEAPDIDVIDICTPTALHPAQVIAALRSGRHVLCEKPLASTSAETKKILQVAKKSRGFLMPAMCMRFWPGWRELKELIAKNTHGRLLTASFRRVSQMPAWNAAQTYSTAAAGGALYDLHIHDTDFVHYLFGRPASVFSSGVTGPNGAINHIITQYQYPKGPAVSATGTWLHQGAFNMGFTLNFERATLTCDLTNGGAWHIDAIGKKTRVIKPRGTDGYDAEIRYFADCITRGVAPDAVTAADAVATLQTCEAEERSVRQSRCVKLA